MNKKKNVLGTLVIIIIICFIFGAGGFYLGSKFNNNEITNINNTNNNNQTGNDIDLNKNNEDVNLEYDSWITYIINSNINSVVVDYCVATGNIEMSDYNVVNKTINITSSDLNRILAEMKKGKVTKNYYGGLGGDCSYGIDINYTTNKNYNVRLQSNKYISYDYNNVDEVGLAYLENTNYTIKKWSENIDLETEEYMFEYTYDDSIIDTIINEYTK